MKKLICKCDRCGVEVKETDLLIIPNPSFSKNTYYASGAPFAVHPRSFDLCIDCTDKLIGLIRDYCTNSNLL